MGLGVFIYARADSRRLPRKVLRPFGRSTLLQHVIDRALQVNAARWSLLTSDRRVDDPIASAAHDAGLDVVRGSAENLVSRTLTAVESLEVTQFVRVNADSPLFEPRLVNAALQRERRAGFVSNVVERRFPYGVAVEIVDAMLYVQLADTAQADELEHVTKHLYRQLDGSAVLSLSQRADHSHLHLAVDTKEDYERGRALFYGPNSRLAPYWELLGLQRPVLRWNNGGNTFTI